MTFVGSCYGIEVCFESSLEEYFGPSIKNDNLDPFVETDIPDPSCTMYHFHWKSTYLLDPLNYQPL